MENNTDTITNEGAPLQKQPLFQKDFTLVVLGQIISLFGNAILRFALPLYILDQSGSAALFGLVSASSFLPMIIMSPIGGIIADRVNKQRIMVVLDFSTAALILGFILVNNNISLVPLVVVVLMLLYGIQGAYNPAVQASLPILTPGENLVPANAVVNLVNSFSGLLGPVIGGMLYGSFGLSPILIVSCGCFLFAAIMELFIHIPHKRQAANGSILDIVKNDMSQSVRFIIKEKPVLAKVIVILFLFNLFFSSMTVIGLPVIITQFLGMSSQHYGFSQGALAAGGLTGGLIAGVFGKKLNIRNFYLTLLACAIGLIPMVLVLLPGVTAFVSYLVITILCFLLMVVATLLSIQLMAFVQAQTPVEIIGKVISCLVGLAICAQPIGQALYGLLFEEMSASPWIVVLGAAIASGLIALYSKAVFSKVEV